MRKAVGYAVAACTGAVLVGALAFGIVAPVRVGHGTPAAHAWLATNRLTATVPYTGWARDIEGRLDGRSVPVHVDAAAHTATIEASHLAEGPHDFKIVFHQAFVLRDQAWAERIFVASRPPSVHLESPAEGSLTRAGTVEVAGRTEPETRMQVDDQAPFDTGPTGQFSIQVPIKEGDNTLAIRGINRAGVERRLERHVLCDLSPPAIVSMLPADRGKVKDDKPVIKAEATDSGSGLMRVTMQVDERPPVEVWVAPEGEPVPRASVRYKCPELAEGTRSVKVVVEDRAGWKTENRYQFLVDSTETFGDKSMTEGAVGADVAALQKHLVHQGYMDKDQVTSRFDKTTLAAVKTFQEEHHIKADGVVGPSSIDLLSPHIVVNLSRFQLVLVEGDDVIKRYTIACGMPDHPTPTGEFRVAEMIANPPWIPPKGSLWARELKTIPPGPGNPLGTRWIGLNSDVVGIHGTNADWTIGSAASHGCMRMHIPDVEDLFRRVNVGTHVTILSGRGQSKWLSKLWPTSKG